MKRSIMKAAKKYKATQIVSLSRPDGKNEVVFVGPDLQWEDWRDAANAHPDYVIEMMCNV